MSFRSSRVSPTADRSRSGSEGIEGISEPARGLARLLFRLRRQGPVWIWRRLKSEWVLPTTPVGRVLHGMLRRSLTTVLRTVRTLIAFADRHEFWKDDILYAFYDLKVEPITYDVIWFLVSADVERRRRGLRQIHFIIVPGTFDGVRHEDPVYEAVVDREARGWRIHNILVPAAGFLYSCAGLTHASSRIQASMIRARSGNRIYPPTYEPALPVAHHPKHFLEPARSGLRQVGSLRATPQGLRYVDLWISPRANGRRLVSVTLRSYAYGKDRNSNLASWAEFARGLDPKIWWLVFVLDTEHALEDTPEPIRGFDVFREVSWNIHLRMAFYERAWLNLGVNNGPMALCWSNERTRYITFKMATPSVPQATEAANRARGFYAGQSLPFATPFQKWVWEDDTLHVIQREFAAMTTVIESVEEAAPESVS